MSHFTVSTFAPNTATCHLTFLFSSETSHNRVEAQYIKSFDIRVHYSKCTKMQDSQCTLIRTLIQSSSTQTGHLDR